MPNGTMSGPSLRYLHRHGVPCTITTTEATVDNTTDWDDTSYTAQSISTVCIMGAYGSGAAERDEANARLDVARDITIPATALKDNPAFVLADADSPMTSTLEVDDYVAGVSDTTPTDSDADTATDTTFRYKIVGFTRTMGGLLLDCERVERDTP